MDIVELVFKDPFVLKVIDLELDIWWNPIRLHLD